MSKGRWWLGVLEDGETPVAEKGEQSGPENANKCCADWGRRVPIFRPRTEKKIVIWKMSAKEVGQAPKD